MENKYEHLHDNFYKNLKSGEIFQLPDDAPSVEEYFALKAEVRELALKAATILRPYDHLLRQKEHFTEKLRSSGGELATPQSTEGDHQ
jgi:hypothetical protein